jgi:hypothetical protein
VELKAVAIVADLNQLHELVEGFESVLRELWGEWKGMISWGLSGGLSGLSWRSFNSLESQFIPEGLFIRSKGI